MTCSCPDCPRRGTDSPTLVPEGLGVGALRWSQGQWHADDQARSLLAGTDPSSLPLVRWFLASSEESMVSWAFLEPGACQVRLRRGPDGVSGALVSAAGLSLPLAFVTHELGTPLAVLQASAALLPQPAAAPATAAAARAQALVELSRALVTGDVDEPAPLSLQDATRSAMRLAGLEQQHADMPADEVIVRGHRLALEQALANLIGNAVRHGRPPVTVRVCAAYEDDRGPGVAPPGYGVVHVVDSGPGTDWAQAVRPGVRGPGSPGMGAGLSIALLLSSVAGALMGFGPAPSQVWLALPSA